DPPRDLIFLDLHDKIEIEVLGILHLHSLEFRLGDFIIIFNLRYYISMEERVAIVLCTGTRDCHMKTPELNLLIHSRTYMILRMHQFDVSVCLITAVLWKAQNNGIGENSAYRSKYFSQLISDSRNE
ncbi:hypothetical protein L9F63_022721, partial [Diploptera punctata]